MSLLFIGLWLNARGLPVHSIEGDSQPLGAGRGGAGRGGAGRGGAGAMACASVLVVE